MSRTTFRLTLTTIIALICSPSISFGQFGGLGGSGMQGQGFGMPKREPKAALSTVIKPLQFEAVSADCARTWIKLNKKVDVSVENGATLKDFLAIVKKASAGTNEPPADNPPADNRTRSNGIAAIVKQASAGTNEPPLSLFVEPRALKEKKIELASTVVASFDKVPLASVLELTLGQLELSYYVRQDGVVVIDSEGSERVRDKRTVLSEKAAKTWLALSREVEIPFAQETILEDVVKFLNQSLIERDRGPVPIYVDPEGLQKADKTLMSTIVLKLKGVPLSTSLQLITTQLDLTYVVTDDGMIMIVAERDFAEKKPGSTHDPFAGPAPNTTSR